jgi:microcystin-dependent protein
MALKNGRTTAALQTILVGSVIPPGVIQAFGGGTVPSGWLLCDGSTASRSTYAGLFAAVGIVNGQGDGSTTFHLPDLRGRFIRGADYDIMSIVNEHNGEFEIVAQNSGIVEEPIV